MNKPKIIFKVDLSHNNVVKFRILYLNEKYSEIQSGFHFVSKNRFMLYKSKMFHMFKENETMCLPEKLDMTRPSLSIIKFDNDINRYNYLKKLHDCLIDWSKSSYWNGFKTNKDSKIIFNKSLWVLF